MANMDVMTKADVALFVGMSVSESLSNAEVARLLNRHGASTFTEDVRLLFEDYFTHHAATDEMQFSDDDDSDAEPVMPYESIETSQPVIVQHHEDNSELRPVVEPAVTLSSADLSVESSSAVDDKKLDKFLATGCGCACNCTTLFTRDIIRQSLLDSTELDMYCGVTSISCFWGP